MLNDGFTAGLRIWIIFLIFFIVLKYPTVFSICLALLAGFAGGLITSFLTTKAQVPPTPREDGGLAKRLSSFNWRKKDVDGAKGYPKTLKGWSDRRKKR